MVAAGAADDFQPYMILPEVKEPKNWWGGHIWEDNVSTKKYIYAVSLLHERNLLA